MLVGLQDLQLAPGCVALNGFQAVGPAQLGLVRRLDAGLPEQVVGQVALVLELGESRRVDGARVTEDLRHQGAIEVLALRLDVDLHPGKGERLLRDDVRHVAGHVLRDADQVEPGSGVFVDRGVDIGRIHPEEIRGTKEGDALDVIPVEVREQQVDRSDLHGETRLVLDERPSVAIEDEASSRRNGLLNSPILGRDLCVLDALGNLEIEQAG